MYILDTKFNEKKNNYFAHKKFSKYVNYKLFFNVVAINSILAL